VTHTHTRAQNGHPGTVELYQYTVKGVAHFSCKMPSTHKSASFVKKLCDVVHGDYVDKYSN